MQERDRDKVEPEKSGHSNAASSHHLVITLTTTRHGAGNLRERVCASTGHSRQLGAAMAFLLLVSEEKTSPAPAYVTNG